MQHDDLVWKFIGKGFCSFKTKFEKTSMCRNEYNLNGLCSPETCPLANSRYATVREEKGVCYLYIKTAERAHTPSKWWEKIQLPKNYIEALKAIDQNLDFWPEYMIHKCKQRYTVIYQYLLKMKNLKKRTKNIVPIIKKIDRRESKREEKALKTANIEKTVRQQLIEKIKNGNYDEIYNFDEEMFEEISKDFDEDVVSGDKVSEYVEDEELDQHTLPDIEDAPMIRKRKMNMVMNIENQGRLRSRMKR